jgi:pimeloyl-ACP methyl ester carboxylesterase
MRSVGALQDKLPCLMTTAASVLLALSVAAAPARAQETFPLPSPDELEPYTHPQRLVEIAPGRRLNLYCTGSGSPIVVMDTGLGNSAWVWAVVQPAVAGLTRVCSYDRAGEGWSDPGPLPRTSSAIVADLYAALSASGESPPYVLVGHSFGGLNILLYTYLHREQIVGLVEVDPAVAGQDVRFAEQIPALGNQGYELNSQVLEVYRNCADLARAGALADLAQQIQAGCNTAFGGDPAAPAFQQAIEFFFARASQWETLASEAENLNATQPGVQPTDTHEVWAARRDLGGGRRPLGALPVVVLQAGDLSNMLFVFPFSSDVQGPYFQVRTEMLGRLAAQSKQGVRVVVPNATHYIQSYQPQTVINTIRQVVCAAQGGAALRLAEPHELGALSSCE